MPRLARLHPIPFGWYYVVVKSVMGRRIVTNQEDLVAIRKVLRRTLREKHARLHAGYVTEGEVHLVLQAGEEPLSTITGRFQHEYARVLNARHGEHGSLFRMHYRSLLFQHQHWLVPLVHFVHWLRRIANEDTGAGGLWWSTDAAYRGEVTEDWVTTSATLRMLSRSAYRRSGQKEAYREFIGRPPDPRHLNLFRGGSEEDPRILGDKEFITETWRRSGVLATASQRRATNIQEDIRRTLEQIIRQFNGLCDTRLPRKQTADWARVLTLENVCSRSRKRPLPMVRALSVSYLADRGIATVADAARFLRRGARSLSARRRRQYEDLFRRWFRVEVGAFFDALTRDGGAGNGKKENLYVAARNPRGQSMI